MADVLAGALGLAVGIGALILGGGSLLGMVFGPSDQMGQQDAEVLLVKVGILAALCVFTVIVTGRLLCLAWVYRWGETSRTEALLYLCFGLVPPGWMTGTHGR